MTLALDTRLDAMGLLRNLEERVRRSGATLPRVVDNRERWSGLRCSVADLNGILPLNDVAEILENRALTPIPGCAGWVKGVVNLRGRLLPVFSVNDFFALGEKSDASCQVIVVDKGPLFCGLAIKRIFGMRKFYRESFLPLDTSLETAQADSLKAMSDFIDAVATIEACNWYQLSIEKLARRIMETSPV